MQRFFENKIAFVTVCGLFVLALLWNCCAGLIVLSAPDATTATFNLLAHGASAPPDPWEGTLIAHGASAPPDPWESIVAHGASAPPDPWESLAG